MNAFFSEQITLTSTCTPDEILRTLSQMVMPLGVYKWWRTTPNTKPYEGQIENTQFHIKRVFQHRNDMAPLIDGKVIPSGNGSLLEVTLSAPPGVKLLLFWVILIFGLVGIIAVTVRAIEGALDLISFAPLIAAILVYVGAYAAYRSEANRARAFLHQLLTAEHANMKSNALETDLH